jgi:hypothetical protein
VDSPRYPQLWHPQEVPPDADLTIVCPRCGTETLARFYGPCPDCRSELRATLGGEGHLLEESDYEPKMNVTPNAVALKD